MARPGCGAASAALQPVRLGEWEAEELANTALALQARLANRRRLPPLAAAAAAAVQELDVKFEHACSVADSSGRQGDSAILRTERARMFSRRPDLAGNELCRPFCAHVSAQLDCYCSEPSNATLLERDMRRMSGSGDLATTDARLRRSVQQFADECWRYMNQELIPFAERTGGHDQPALQRFASAMCTARSLDAGEARDGIVEVCETCLRLAAEAAAAGPALCEQRTGFLGLCGPVKGFTPAWLGSVITELLAALAPLLAPHASPAPAPATSAMAALWSSDLVGEKASATMSQGKAAASPSLRSVNA
ncbi:hypothetical protein C2E21_9558 [Chlorella sorokiniana]|uniref:Uncharacterized protein n=1 Tax=Chlorella sorokiniana TaxID=3076 RepID=A0A2P6TB64_CHLSO|nr:hypothetical protein C2E21_9558 [Chlorella sorokiniana]|eukprot:PRW05795.1 hypothetical protein C2E21_9558 [Chlorella sorokiniana]